MKSNVTENVKQVYHQLVNLLTKKDEAKLIIKYLTYE